MNAMKSAPLLPMLLAGFFLGNSVGRADLTVASLSTITTDLARKIGGDHVKVVEIINPGVNPHEFEPTIRDIRKVTDADLVLYTGKGMEGFLPKLREASASKARFVDISSGIPSLKMTEEGKEIVEDPHWWHSVSNMECAARTTVVAFEQADPANKNFYENQEHQLLESLRELERWIRVKLSELPRSKRQLVTSHDALQYFARDYGFTIFPVKGISTGEEPSSKHVKEIIWLIRIQGVKSVFFESIENNRAIDQIGLETGARTGGVLYSDGLGEKEASTYDSMMRHNVSTIVDGLK